MHSALPCSDSLANAYLLGRKETIRLPILAPAGLRWMPGPIMEAGELLGVGGQQLAVASLPCPYGGPGDTLFLAEWFAETHEGCRYRAGSTSSKSDIEWRPPTAMPATLSRMHLEIVSVEIGRFQDIDEAGAIREGVCRLDPGEALTGGPANTADQPWYGYPEWLIGVHDRVRLCPYRGRGSAREAFTVMWDQLYGVGLHDSTHNPWVWVITTKPVRSAS